MDEMCMPDIQVNHFARYIKEWREGKGFETPANFGEKRLLMEKLMLIVTEVSEAAEAVRHDNYMNFEEEIADAIIRILDLTGSMDMDIELAIKEKMKFNHKRPEKHGKAL